MFASVAKWYREWEEEQLAVLKEPALAERAAPGYRRFVAERLAALSPLERQELHDFSARYRGNRLYLALLKLCAVFSVAGLLLRFAFLPQMNWGLALVLANLVGFCMTLALTAVWLHYRKIARAKFKAFIFLLGLDVGGALIGLVFVLLQGHQSLDAIVEKLPRILAIGFVFSTLLYALPLIAIAAWRNRRHELLAAQLLADAERERLARELSESQLRLLRAQIEPHFLFNTLGAVQQLAEQGAPKAAELTANLIDFLRASLGDMRTGQASLQSEFRLVDSYLRVMQARLGHRLRFNLTLPEALAGVQIPSMLVLTLAENAIKHGIEPSLRGGTVWVGAEDTGSGIRIRVRDSGVGMSATPGHGLGLENIRHRLRLAYGESAGLALYDADPGFEAELAIPPQGVQSGAMQ
ncbi:sensor histidine kinase [Massilia sp. AB1]|uniref:sensor histidine kinase n=1 Tax=Massilia sp. AB1 TaxID=2823371 RepID=UPI001B821290|nr:histidine kinase [Massilia sp. AB1]MBQ5939414.1 histidine kinase [Massilia sp. AB1]